MSTRSQQAEQLAVLGCAAQHGRAAVWRMQPCLHCRALVISTGPGLSMHGVRAPLV